MRKKEIDLVLINPGGQRRVYQSLSSTLTAIEPPVWAGLIATFIRGRGFLCHVIDANAEGLSPEEVAGRVADIDPLLAAVVAYGHQPSASTQQMPASGAVCKAIKTEEPDRPVILVGGHVAALPERTLREEAVDFVCDGEGPYTLLDLLSVLKSERQCYQEVRGLRYREGASFRSTPPAPLVMELNREMPGIAWDLLPMERYRAHNWHCFGERKREPYAALYTTLGCPYHCTFCCIQAPFKRGEALLGYRSGVNSYRLWSPGSVIAQIDTLVQKYGVRHIKIADEIFVLNPKHVEGLCDLIIERGYDLNFWAYARVDTVQERLLERLKRAGVNWLAFGIETASERVRKDARKGYEEDQLFQTIEKVRGAGISVIGNYLFGLPEDDLESMDATLRLAVDLNCEFVNFNCAMAYPGSRLYETAVEQGWPLPETWSGYSQHSVDALPLQTKYLSGIDVLRFRDNAFRAYFSNPRYLDMILRKFGPQTVEHIGEMASHRLERRYAPPERGKWNEDEMSLPG